MGVFVVPAGRPTDTESTSYYIAFEQTCMILLTPNAQMEYMQAPHSTLRLRTELRSARDGATLVCCSIPLREGELQAVVVLD